MAIASQRAALTSDGFSADNPPAFNYRLMRDDFHRLLIRVGNELERNWPDKYVEAASAQLILLQLVRLAITNYKAIGFICSDVNDGAVRDPLLVLASPSMNRTILEIIVSVLYLLEDLSEHTDEFFRAAWRDEREMLSKYQERYGGRPRWDQFIAVRTEGVNKLEVNLGITDEEKANPNTIRFWPKPNKVLKRLRDEHPNSNARAYIQFLNDWLYRELSTQSHLEPRGLGQMGLFFLGMKDLQAISGKDPDGVRERLDQKIQEFRTTEVWIAMTLILSLVSEIETYFSFGIKNDLSYFWGLINAHNEISQEVFKERYAGLPVLNDANLHH
jgi:hypothetical protein